MKYNRGMEIDMDKSHWYSNKCPQYDCRKKSCSKCECGLKYVNIPTTLGDNSEGSIMAPKNGMYCNAIVKYEANGAVYIYSADGVPTLLTTDISSSVATRLRNLEMEVAQLRNAVLDKQDRLIAGNGITIEDNVISSTASSASNLMPVVLREAESEYQLPDNTLFAFWESDYTFNQLAENPSLIRIDEVLYGEGITGWIEGFGQLIPIFARVNYAGDGDERHPESILLGFYPAYADPMEEREIDKLFWTRILKPDSNHDNVQYAYIGWVSTNINEDTSDANYL